MLGARRPERRDDPYRAVRDDRAPERKRSPVMAETTSRSRDIAYQLHPFTNLQAHETQGPLVITRGKGVYVYDESGREYIEGLAGLWCAGLGFGEERLVEAAARQLRRLPYYHQFGSKAHDVAIDLAERLVRALPVPMSKVFFNNSGSEANETAIKLVWYYNNALARPRKKKIVSRLRAYHGVTLGAASLTGLHVSHRDFDLPIPQVRHADCPHLYRYGKPGESEEQFASRMAESLDQQIQREDPDTVAAFIAEPVMGAGGVIVPPRTYFEKVQAVLRKHDVLMIADEVICGFGRTGRMFGTETFAIQPDIMVMAKQLTSGYLPLSATAISEPIYQALVKQSEKIGIFAHGYTYTGHPAACAVALEVLQIYEERDMVGHVRRTSPRLLDGLRALADHPLVGEVRGVGLLAGVELVADKATKRPFDPPGSAGTLMVQRAQANGLIVRSLQDTVALCPPLIISDGEVDELLRRFTKALDETTALL
jgi:4-aminobutyrate--pyruvate transaminase